MVAETVNPAEVPRGGQHLPALGQQPRGFRFVGLSDQRDFAIRRQTVDAATAIGGEQDMAGRRQQVVDVLFLRAPQRLHRVIGIDAIQRRFLDARYIEHRSGRGCYSGRLSRLGRGGILRRFHIGSGLGVGSHGDRGDRRGGGARARSGRLPGPLRAPGDRATQRRGVDSSIRGGCDGADLRQIRIVQHEGLVPGADAVQDAVRLAAGEQLPIAVQGQAGDVRLSGLIVNFALAGGGDAEDLALIAGADIQRAVGRDGQRPDVTGAGREVLAGLALQDAIDLSIRRCAGVDGARRVNRQGKDLRLIGRPQKLRAAGFIDLVQAAAVSGGGIDDAVAALCQAPHDGLIGGEQRVDLRRHR